MLNTESGINDALDALSFKGVERIGALGSDSTHGLLVFLAAACSFGSGKNVGVEKKSAIEDSVDGLMEMLLKTINSNDGYSPYELTAYAERVLLLVASRCLQHERRDDEAAKEAYIQGARAAVVLGDCKTMGESLLFISGFLAHYMEGVAALESSEILDELWGLAKQKQGVGIAANGESLERMLNHVAGHN